MSFARWAAVAAMVLGVAGAAGAAEYMEKTDFEKSRAFSPAVIAGLVAGGGLAGHPHDAAEREAVLAEVVRPV